MSPPDPYQFLVWNYSIPGADPILLFAGVAPLAAVPSSCTHVPARIFQGGGARNYNRGYADAQSKIENEIPPSFDACCSNVRARDLQARCAALQRLSGRALLPFAKAKRS